MRSSGFAPIEDCNARLVILGTLPGAESLRQRQYYANPRNAFWPIVCELLEIESFDYDVRCRALIHAGVALWDVCESATRPGSSDAMIDQASVRVNDFKGFLSTHSRIRLILFNGKKAEQMFRQRALPAFDSPLAIELRTLPSTSPANARPGHARKLEQWREAFALIQQPARIRKPAHPQ